MKLTIFFTMVTGDKLVIHVDVDGIVPIDEAINDLCRVPFLHHVTSEGGVQKVMVVNMANVSHMNIVISEE